MRYSKVTQYQAIKNTTKRQFIDLRSDTVTRPYPQMLNFIQDASGGDNVLEEDHDTTQLENRLSTLSGKASGLFCVSGTMTNQLGIRAALKQPPYSIVCDSRSHIYQHESSGLAHLSHALVIPVTPKQKHHLTLDDIKAQVRLDESDVHLAPTKLISLENTLNGTIFEFNELKKISDYCKTNQIHLHLDGARLWNASVKESISIKQYCDLFDSVSLCLSKGLGAPIGSVLLGSESLIQKAKQFRKMIGGGWRQSGMLAKAVDYCLDNHLPLLHKDHERVQELATKLENLGLTFDYPPHTNMLFVNFQNYNISSEEIVKKLQDEGILCYSYGPYSIRLVFYFQLPDNVINEVVEKFQKILIPN